MGFGSPYIAALTNLVEGREDAVYGIKSDLRRVLKQCAQFDLADRGDQALADR